MVDKASGKTVIGIQAPTDKTLVSWLKQHQSYEVLLPAGKPGKGMYMIKSMNHNSLGCEQPYITQA